MEGLKVERAHENMIVFIVFSCAPVILKALIAKVEISAVHALPTYLSVFLTASKTTSHVIFLERVFFFNCTNFTNLWICVIDSV